MEKLTHTVHFLQTNGSSYEVGVKQGEKLAELYGPDYFAKVSEVTPKNSSLLRAIGIRPLSELTPAEIAQNAKLAEKTISKSDPELLDELAGLADALNAPLEQVLAFTTNYFPGGCSAFIANGNLCRNYDDDLHGVDNLFLLTKTPNAYRHFGSSTETLGRYDGMNDQGLAVALTFGAGYASTEPGIGAVLYLRFALDKAKTVKEALEIFKQTPYVSPNNVMLLDKTGDKALIEVSKGKSEITRGDEVLYCANSYQNPKLQDSHAIKNITTGYRELVMARKVPDMKDPREMMLLLTTDFPSGLFEPHYAEGLGTLWSLVMNPKNLTTQLAIGETGENIVQTIIDLNDASPELPNTMSVSVRNVGFEEEKDRITHLLRTKAKRFKSN